MFSIGLTKLKHSGRRCLKLVDKQRANIASLVIFQESYAEADIFKTRTVAMLALISYNHFSNKLRIIKRIDIIKDKMNLESLRNLSLNLVILILT